MISSGTGLDSAWMEEQVAALDPDLAIYGWYTSHACVNNISHFIIIDLTICLYSAGGEERE